MEDNVVSLDSLMRYSSSMADDTAITVLAIASGLSTPEIVGFS
jgi:hypothetical protein